MRTVDFKFTVAPDWSWAVEARGPAEQIERLRLGSRVGVKLRGGSYRQVELLERVSLAKSGKLAVFKIRDWKSR